MGCMIPFDENQPFEEKVKCLADEELLEIWAESQQIESMISSGLPAGCIMSANYEQIIINELSLRHNRKLASNNL